MSETEGPDDAPAPAEDQGGASTEPAPLDAAPKAPSPVAYEALWVAFRDGARTKRALMRAMGVGWRLAHAAIETGWPDAGMPSLRNRVEMWDRQKERARADEIAAVDRRAAESQGKAEAVSWRTFQPRALKACVDGQAILDALAGKIAAAARAATFVRYRRVQKLVADEKNPTAAPRSVAVDEPYVSHLDVAHAAKLWASASKDNVQVAALLTGQLRAAGAPASDAPELTEAQIAELRAGRMPAGVTLEQLYAAALVAQAEGGS